MKYEKTRVAERLMQIKKLLRAPTLIHLGDIEKLVDECLKELQPRKGKVKS